MSKPYATKTNRISRDSGICVEDGSPSESPRNSYDPSESAPKKRFPAGGGKTARIRVQSSYVRQLARHFENLCSHDERDHGSSSSIPTSSSPDRTVYHSDWNLSTTPSQVLQQAEAKQQVPSVNECDKNKAKMDDAVQVIESIYEEIIVGKKISGKFAINDHIRPPSDCYMGQSEDHLVEDETDNNNPCSGDKIPVGDFESESIRTLDFAEEVSENSVVTEARNTLISQESTDHDHYCDDDEFSDTDSFDSTDDEEHALNNSRPDSNSSIKSERITSIMKELLENEENYVQTLRKGIEDYMNVMNQKDLPLGLKGQRYHIFGNIESIYELHKDKFLPKLRENRASIQGIAETFIKFIEDDRFYCYILFALNRPKSEKICNKNLDFFQEIQNVVGDKLGLNSFLLQPIQRLPRYKLLLAEINKEVLKLIADALLDSVKDEIGVLCKAEKRLERFIDVVNEAMSINDIRECYEVNLLHQGKFRKMFEMDIYDWDRRRRYPGKIFFFEKCIIYTEKFKDYLEYRGHYVDSEVGLHNEGRMKLNVFAQKRGIREVEFSGSDISSVQKMATYIENVMHGFAMQERQRINDLSRKRDRYEQRVPSVMTINRGSYASSRSAFSITSNTSNRDSLESTSQTTWDSEVPFPNLASSQKHFCQILAANRKHYFNELPEELSDKISQFINVYDQLLEIHTKRVLEDFMQSDLGIDEICELFIEYFKVDLFEPYNTYLRYFKKAAGIMKNIHKASRSSLSTTMVAQSAEDFTFLLIDIWNKYQNFVQSRIVQMSEEMNGNVDEVDKDLFRKLAFVEVQINTFRTTLLQNYRLYNLDEGISVSSHGLVVYSERIRYGNETISNHRILLCEKAAICVRVQLVKEIERKVEKYNRIVFVEKFKPGIPAAGLSRKSEMRLNFEINGRKHPVDFAHKAGRDKFLGNYRMMFERQSKLV
ncbi:uncharacterized protein LOC129765450 isoform X2 [Toxorhynchites rutilus septentrionalis]|uniref:uncharacterized protein LOC129765450 isoform X2 n=1 Tax=Toxorhynchites rutilus septentrionalis TaxID=329112 RepID=UPI00247A2F1C|nr:uncharacterized protein LOC129765450 isoform X2 [Toxorhynchites rutilus septentrionalis]